MKDWLKVLYVCYLGKNKGCRLDAIVRLIKEHNGEEFFRRFSLPEDTILDFINRCKEQGIDL